MAPYRDPKTGRFAKRPKRKAQTVPDFAKSPSPYRDSKGRFAKRLSPKKAPKRTTEKAPKRTPKKAPKRTPKKAPKRTPKKAPRKPPKRTTEKAPKKVPKKDPKKVFRKPPRLSGDRYKIPGATKGRQEMQEYLTEVADWFRSLGMDARVYLHTYSNGMTDGQVVVITGGSDPLEAMQVLQEVTAVSKAPKGTWFSTGFRFEPIDDTERYTRYKGLEQVARHYQKPESQKMALNIEGTALAIENFQNMYGGIVDRIFLRLNWNPQGKRPSKD